MSESNESTPDRPASARFRPARHNPGAEAGRAPDEQVESALHAWPAAGDNGRQRPVENDARASGGSSRTPANLEWREARQGRLPGERYVRIIRPHAGMLRRLEPGHMLATERVLEGHSWSERLWNRVRRVAIGQPLTTSQLLHERLTKVKALAVFASDALSSSAYAPEEILIVLVLAGSVALGLAVPISLAIAALLAIVIFSYRQTIKAYPQGGGSYIVTKDNLGTLPALVAAASLLVGYVLTVAVSIAAGVANLTSAVPVLLPYRVELASAFIVLIAMINLRGVKESGSILALPTYMFIVAIAAMGGAAAWRLTMGLGPAVPIEATALPIIEPLTLFLVLRAFSSGCSALTGTEAISDGVPAFKAPEWINARQTLTAMGVILGVMFVSISAIAVSFGITPREGETIISQVARASFGPGPLYFFVQAATMLILVLAANTAFADFPRLSYFLARDGFMPRQFQNRGDRLAFSTGILALTGLAVILVVVFNAETHALLPLYAIGVFVAFTCSQSAMVRRWWTKREPGWRWSMPINAIGATATGVVAFVFAATKFADGAWMVLVIIPAFILLLLGIHRHYNSVADELDIAKHEGPLPRPHVPFVIVPTDGLHLGTVHGVAYARSISADVVAVTVTDDMDAAHEMKDRWEGLGLDVPLIILESPYRSFVAPLIAYIDAAQSQRPNSPITIVLPEYVPKHWWGFLLHNQSALRLKVRLFFRRNTVVVDAPYHLRH